VYNMFYRLWSFTSPGYTKRVMNKQKGVAMTPSITHNVCLIDSILVQIVEFLTRTLQSDLTYLICMSCESHVSQRNRKWQNTVSSRVRGQVMKYRYYQTINICAFSGERGYDSEAKYRTTMSLNIIRVLIPWAISDFPLSNLGFSLHPRPSKL
jgi:hypothetical protein